MTLNEALASIKSGGGREGNRRPHYLVCGFEPLHLKTFLGAHLLQRWPDFGIEILHGLYGDLTGNLSLAAESSALTAAVVIEWGDIDPRLGLRASGGWAEEVKPDIVASAEVRLSQIEAGLARLAERIPAAVVGPCLPLLPVGNTIRAQSSVVELELEHLVTSFLLRISRLNGVRVVNRSRFDGIGYADRLDARMELLAGFPYTNSFADALASAFTSVLCQATPKKGLITDLDDTLWAGIVGEIGADKVTWQQESHSQVHGLYQQMLAQLASTGVLLAVCSKNEQTTAEAALARPDLFLKSESLFPVCANWEPKSQSVARILRAWNISEDAVVFIDDSPMELDEVQRAFPGILCRQFPKKNPAKLWELLGELRDLFGKPRLMEEDRLRQKSLRTSVAIQDMGEAAGSDEFLAGLGATVTIDWRFDSSDLRPLELINKTNQFNLNGRRIGDGEWRRYQDDSRTVLSVVSYADKFGPLGKVAVVLGATDGERLRISHWVMSCRAFSRRLEHHTLDALFRETGAREIEFDFEATDKNKPLQDFFQAAGISPDASGVYRISHSEFLLSKFTLPHRVVNLKK